MAPDPPRVGNEYLQSVDPDLLPTAVNSDESDSNNDELDSAQEFMQAHGYTLFVSDIDASYHYNSSVFDDDDSDVDINNGISSDDHSVNEQSTNSLEESQPSSSVVQSTLLQFNKNEKGEDEFEKGVVERCTSDCESTSMSDIKIDCDQVKAAMIGFTLPPSAIPDWAIGISDQDIASHVNRLLMKNNKK